MRLSILAASMVLLVVGVVVPGPARSATDMLKAAPGRSADWGMVPEPMPEQLEVIAGDVAAQGAGEAEAFLALRSENPVAAEDRRLLESHWSRYPTYNILVNIEAARLVGIRALPPRLAGGMTRLDRYTEVFGESRAFYVGIEYRWKQERRELYNGVNYRLYVLAPEKGRWVIVEASEARVKAIVDAGFGFGTEEERQAQHIQEVRSRTGKFINIRDDVIGRVGAR